MLIRASRLALLAALSVLLLPTGSTSPASAPTGSRLAEVWHVDIPLPSDSDSVGARWRGRLALSTRLGFTAVDMLSGAQVWRYARDDLVVGNWMSLGDVLVAEYSRPGATEDITSLIAIGGYTGRELWRRDGLRMAGAWKGDRGDVKRDRVAVAATESGKELVGLDLRDGHTVWRRGVRDCQTDSVGMENGQPVLTGSCPGRDRLSMLDGATGRDVWSLLVTRASDVDVSLADDLIGLVVDHAVVLLDTAGHKIAARSGCWPGCPVVRVGDRAVVAYQAGPDAVLEAVDVRTARSYWRLVRHSQSFPSWYQGLLTDGRSVYGMLMRDEITYLLHEVDPKTGRGETLAVPVWGRTIAGAGGDFYLAQTRSHPGQAPVRRLTLLRRSPGGDGPPELSGVSPAAWPDACALLPEAHLTAIPRNRHIGDVTVPSPHACDYAGHQGEIVRTRIARVAPDRRQAQAYMTSVQVDDSAYQVRGVGDQAIVFPGYPKAVVVRAGNVVFSMEQAGAPGAVDLLALARRAADHLRSHEDRENAAQQVPSSPGLRPAWLSKSGIVVYEDQDDPVRLIGYVPQDGLIRVRTAPDGTSTKEISGDSAISPDGRSAVTASTSFPSSGRDTTRITDLASGAGSFVSTVRAPRGLSWPSWSPDGRKILMTIRQAHGSQERSLGFTVIDVASLKAHSVNIDDPDAQYTWLGKGTMVASSTDKRIDLYSPDGRPIRRLLGKGTPDVDGMGADSPSGRRFSTWCPGNEAEICIWNVSDGASVARIPYDAPRVVGWWDEDHLIVWADDQEKAPHRAVVIDFRGKVTRTLIRAGDRDYEDGRLGLIFTRTSAGAAG
ncbi:hypothetical protein Mame01_62790 [Microbispora amethystogenes]|nr:hypothetical protein Mame01_62790 [Microbispora amethystogenes]